MNIPRSELLKSSPVKTRPTAPSATSSPDSDSSLPVAQVHAAGVTFDFSRSHPVHSLSGGLGSLVNIHPDDEYFSSLPLLLPRSKTRRWRHLHPDLQHPLLLIGLTHTCFLLFPELSGHTPASERWLLGLPLAQNALSSRRLLGWFPPVLQVFVYISHSQWESPFLY